MKPASGLYRLRWTDEDGDVVEITVRVKANGKIPTPWGPLVYDATIDAFRCGLIGLECTGVGSFIGINDTPPPHAGISGTCERIGD